jgi:hypothetical protein
MEITANVARLSQWEVLTTGFSPKIILDPERVAAMHLQNEAEAQSYVDGLTADQPDTQQRAEFPSRGLRLVNRQRVVGQMVGYMLAQGVDIIGALDSDNIRTGLGD